MSKKNNMYGSFCNVFGTTDFSNYVPDFSSLVAAQQRNVNAWFQANDAVWKNAQAIMLRGCEMWCDSVRDYAATIGKINVSSSPQDKISGQSDMARAAMEKAVSNGKELMEMASGFQQQAADMVSSRVSDAFAQFRAASGQKK